MKKITILSLLLSIFMPTWAQKTVTVKSPDGQVEMRLNVTAEGLTYDLFRAGNAVLTGNTMGLELNGKEITAAPKITGQKTIHLQETIRPVVPLKFSTIQNDCNEATVNFKNQFSVVLRAYNDGVAYRFVTRQKGQVEVNNETISLNVPQSWKLHLQEPKDFWTSYEEKYTHKTRAEWTEGTMSNLPVLMEGPNCKVLVCETDLQDYPCAFLKNTDNDLKSVFPPMPLKFEPWYDRRLKIAEAADYIAKTEGTRAFPWRYMVIGNDAQIVENTMSARLIGNNCELADTDWIKPGRVSWDWWNRWSIYGPDVNFVAGINTPTYKYYIDFASKYGLEYIIMDEGWSASTTDVFHANPDVDLEGLIRYGAQKNVGIVLWLTWLAVEENPTLLETIASWGVKGVKIDFMDRSDQWMVNWYERTAKEAAKHHLFVDYHGAFKPAGLEFRYPNVLSYEGVRGMEQMGTCVPENSIYFPFMRNAVGAMDYTPGAMQSTQPERYGAEAPNAMSIGTRAYQLALFVVFESGIQMLADSPTEYLKRPECTEFLASVPVTWDETRVLDAKAGEYILVAKRKGDEWFIGGMTNNTPRDLTVKLDFLTAGKSYTQTSFTDGPNAHRQAMDYRKNVNTVNSQGTLQVKMARNGGFAAVLK